MPAWLPVLIVLVGACKPAATPPPVVPSGEAVAPAQPQEPAPLEAPPPQIGAEQPAPAPEPPLRIAFGSCNDLRQPQRLWGTIAELDPQLWIWLGDNIYADTTNMKKMRALYEQARAEPGYAALAAKTPVVGTWDDHDYGNNDAGKEYPKRKQAQQLLLDFLDEPADSPRRKQAGVYASYDIGEDDRIVRVIVLDTRYHRDRPGPAADILGDAQWRWLQRQLTDSPAAVHLIVSSIQVVASSHPHEKWANFPAARQRLLALLSMSDARNIIVISGDRHYAELSRIELPYAGALYDLTSSSLSRPWDTDPNEPNPDRVGDYYHRVNFGLIEVDWAGGRIALEVRGEGGQAQIRHEIPLAP